MKWGDMHSATKTTAMPRDDARALLGLGLSDKLDTDVIRSAYRKACMDNHPDTAPGTLGKVDIRDLQHARDILLDGLNQGQEISCKLCSGSGRVGVGFGAPCTACHGTGQQNG